MSSTELLSSKRKLAEVWIAGFFINSVQLRIFCYSRGIVRAKVERDGALDCANQYLRSTGSSREIIPWTAKREGEVVKGFLLVSQIAFRLLDKPAPALEPPNNLKEMFLYWFPHDVIRAHPKHFPGGFDWSYSAWPRTLPYSSSIKEVISNFIDKVKREKMKRAEMAVAKKASVVDTMAPCDTHLEM